MRDAVKNQIVKFSVLAALSVISFGYVMISTGTFTVGKPGVRMIQGAELAQLSPLIAFAGIVDDGKWLRGRVLETEWDPLDATQRRMAADRLAKKLSELGVPNAELLRYKTPALRIELGVVTYVDTAKPP